MSNTIKFHCSINTSDANAQLGMEIWLDDQQIFNQDHVTQKIDFCYELSDLDAEHELRFVMKNKTAEHTKIDLEGNIIKDACLLLDNIDFDDIQLGHMFTELAVYTHDLNGTQNQIQDQFYGTMGCNGQVSLKFSTPVYLWLLEHL